MNPKDWFKDQKWGVFTHYLYLAQNNPDRLVNQGAGQTSWNECVDALDVERFTAQLAEAGAHYLMFTVMQGTKYLCAPNETYDRIIGAKPGEACCKRDLIRDLIKALDRYGISLFLYYTGDGPHADLAAGEAMGFHDRYVVLNENFLENWSSVAREYSLRYGDKIRGWWVDGCYKVHGNFNYNDHWLEYYVKAMRAGNKETLLAFNNGVSEKVRYYTPLDDYVCGEMNYFEDIPETRFINGVQWHILAPLGVPPKGKEPNNAWCKPGCKHSAEYMRDYVKKVNDKGGVVTIDVALYRDGHIGTEQMAVLKALKDL
jgi:alpha-L-fucosidase